MASIPSELGDYLVEETLGSGGMGTVFAVRHRSSPLPLAMKVLSRAHTLDPLFRERFVREGQTARTLESEHVVKVWGSGVLDTGQPFIVMERLSGVDLDALLDAHGPMTIPFVVDVALQVCAALAEAHALGIVHRDLKPANLYLARRADGSSIIKVFDFGISKAAISDRREITETKATLGTPAYMAPEQIRSSRSVDPRADLWSLGVTIFELLTGKLPFDGDNIGELASAVLFEPPRKLRDFRPDVPAALVAIVARCLTKDLDQRYLNVNELLNDLRALRPSVRPPAWYDDATTKLIRPTESEPPPKNSLFGVMVIAASLAFLVATVSTLLIAFHDQWFTWSERVPALVSARLW